VPNAHLVTANASEEATLRELGVEQFDGAVVATGNLQANILVTQILKDIGLPMIMTRADDELHARVLERVGADSVVQPEKEFASLASRKLVYPGTLDYLELGEDEAVVEIEVPKEWVGKSLSELHLYEEQGLTVLAHKSRGRSGTMPKGDATFQEEDVVVIGGSQEDLNQAGFFQQQQQQ
jgi:trk system potassium uptake protein TrkA